MRETYGVKLPGEGDLSVPRVVVCLDSGEGFRFPILKRLKFVEDTRDHSISESTYAAAPSLAAS